MATGTKPAKGLINPPRRAMREEVQEGCKQTMWVQGSKMSGPRVDNMQGGGSTAPSALGCVQAMPTRATTCTRWGVVPLNMPHHTTLMWP